MPLLQHPLEIPAKQRSRNLPSNYNKIKAMLTKLWGNPNYGGLSTIILFDLED